MACDTCGAKKGHLNGCSQIQFTSSSSRKMAKEKTQDDIECPPHNWYKFASGKSLGRKWRTDKCLRTGCDASHTYYI